MNCFEIPPLYNLLQFGKTYRKDLLNTPPPPNTAILRTDFQTPRKFCFLNAKSLFDCNDILIHQVLANGTVLDCLSTLRKDNTGMMSLKYKTLDLFLIF